MKDYTPDYLCAYNKLTPAKKREKENCWNIFINWAVCLKCKEFIRSNNVHDFRTCKCWNLSVDWWSHYTKRTFKEGKDSYVNVIEEFEELIK